MTELRNRLSAILDEVAAGTPYLITRYGKPVAALVPASWYPTEEDHR